MTDYTLRAARPEDRDFLFALYAGTRADEIAAWGWDAAQSDAFLRMQFEAMRRGYAERFAGAAHDIILRAGAPVGRRLVHDEGDALRLVDVSILPTQRGAGLGTAVLRDLLAAGKPVRLTVRVGNPARRLYARLGFVTTARTDLDEEMAWSPG